MYATGTMAKTVGDKVSNVLLRRTYFWLDEWRINNPCDEDIDEPFKREREACDDSGAEQLFGI